MSSGKTYVGIDNDEYGGMTPTGAIVKDAWLFGLIPEEETCEGWTVAALQHLYDQVTEHWSRYGYRVNQLPPELQERHTRIHEAAMKRARALGWDPDPADEED